MDIHNARINPAGAFVCLNGLYPFALVSLPHNGRIPSFVWEAIGKSKVA
jgi:hypothetical protein